MIFQDPLTSLTPHMKVGAQIIEALTLHRKMPRDEAEARAREMLDYVRIPESARRMKQYPHELSGGMRQRVMIAMATITGPDLIIADEPTTALDVTVQAQILEILRALKTDKKTAIALVSHDMGVIAGMADRVQVMRHGEIVESGTADEIFYAPAPRLYPHAAGGDAARPTRRRRRPPRSGAPLLDGGRPESQLSRSATACSRKPQTLRAVDGVSFTLHQGETLGVVGESGCGKSTLARAVLQLLPKNGGTGGVAGPRPGRSRRRADIRALREDFQIVFQDPLASLDPRMPIGVSIAEPLRALEPQLVARRGARASARDDGAGRARSRLDQPLSARTVRRPEPARRHRPRHDRGAAAWWSATRRSARWTFPSRRRSWR